jgi:hypothetical protein
MSAIELQVKTADEAGAGTDSNIFVVLVGEFEQSQELRLNGLIGHNAFERNSTEDIQLTGLPNLGRIYEILVRSDTRYWGSDWRLNWMRTVPRDPPYPPSTFNYNGWIGDTGTKELYASDWPWAVAYNGNRPEMNIAQRISLFNLLDSDHAVEQEYKVTYELENQVQVNVETKDVTKLAESIEWTSPQALKALGELKAKFSAEWDKEITNRRVDTASEKLVVEDRRKQTFPAGKLTLVAADWTELWEKAIATLGSTSIAMRWLKAAPMNPSWTIGSYAKGDRIPEPFASFLEAKYPALARLFVTTPGPVKPVIGELKATPAKPRAGKPLTVAMPLARSDTGTRLPAVTQLSIAPTLNGKVLRHQEAFKNGRASATLTVPASAKGKVLTLNTQVKFGGKIARKTSRVKVL